MRYRILTVLALFISVTVLSQGERIILSEKKQGKRIVLMAENTTKDSLNVFLMVTSEGYRRSADRPIIKKIPPSGKTPMITLIEINNVPSSYHYTLVVNEEENNLSFAQAKRGINLEKLISEKLVLFTSEGCEKCEALSDALVLKDIAYRSLDIKKEPALYKQFNDFIKKKQPKKIIVRLPVIWNKDYAIYGYDNLKEILKILAN